MKNKFFTLLLAMMASVGTMFAQSGTSTIADIYNMEQGAAITLGAFDVVYVASLQNGANIYIKDATGSIVIYKPSYGLQAGDHVEAGMEGTVNIYHGLYEIAPLSAKEDLTITKGEAPAPMEAVEVPTMANVNQYVVYKNVSFASDTAFVEGRRHTVLGVWNNQEVSFYNQYYIGATLKADKKYNVVAVNTVYGTTLQAYPISVEEVGKQNSNTITIAEAIEIGMALDSMATSTETYTIEGYVINAGTFSEQYKTQSWYMADDKNATTSSFQAYRCYPIYGKDTVAVTNGNKVRMTGKLQKYYSRANAVYTVEMTRVPATIFDLQEEIETITVAQALEIGSTLESMAVTEKEYIIKGYVSNIITPYDAIYKNETFFITDVKGARTNDKTQAFEIYRGKPNTQKEIGLDAYIQIKCKIKNYRGIIENELANTVFEVLEQGHGVEDDTPTPCISASGTCGENLTWELSCDSVLTISGTGEMESYTYCTCPWAEYLNDFAIRSIVIEEGVTTLSKYAFSCSVVLSKVDVFISSTVTSIDHDAFNLCGPAFYVDENNPNYSSIDGVLFDKAQTILIAYPSRKTDKQYTIPNTVNTIGVSAFNGCDYLESVIIPNSVTTIESSAFRYCDVLSSVSIANSVEKIGYDAFEYCDNLPTIFIPSSVTFIGSSVFAGDNKLKSINVDEANPNYSSLDGVLFNKDQTILMQYPLGKEDTVYTIPNTVTTISYMAFSYINKYCNLASLIIPNSVETIVNHAFWNCEGLTSVTNLAIEPQSMAAKAFEYANFTYSTLYVPAESLDAYKAANGWKEFGTILPIEETPCLIASGACGNNLTWELSCDSVLTISGIGEMENYKYSAAPWFDHGSIVLSVVIEDGVTSIGDYAFADCQTLRSVEIPNSVISIGSRAFLYCFDLTSIKLPDNLTTIQERAFASCINLTSVVIPNNVTTIEEYAFQECSKMVSVSIPESVTNIAEYAFFSCYSLMSIYNYSSTPQIINENVFGGKPQYFYPGGGSIEINQEALDKSKCTLYVPAQSLEAYKAADVWKDFGTILPIGETKDFITVAEALEIGSALEIGAVTEKEYVIQGYVSYITTPYDDQYKNETFWITDVKGSRTSDKTQAFEVYRGKPNTQKEIGLDALIQIQCKIKNYNGTIENNGVNVVFEVLEQGFVAIPDTITVAQALEIGSTLEPMAVTENEYVVKGYVSNIATPYDTIYKNETFFITDVKGTRTSDKTQAFEVYRGKPNTQKEIGLDAYIQIKCKLKNYNGFIENEIANTVFEVLEQGSDVIDDTPTSCYIAYGSCGNNLTWELGCDSVLTISGTGAMWRLTEEQAWRPYKESIKVAILPEGLDSIAPKAFYQCVNLTSVNLPNSVRAVGYAALYDCERLAVPVYNDRILAFMPFDHAGTYTVPEGIVALASYAFQPSSDHYATEIVLPSSLKQLGAYSLGWGYQKLTCLATTPPVCDKYKHGVFSFYFDDAGVVLSVDRSIPVYVPAGSVEAYKAADQWKDFFNIQAIPTDPQDANLEVVYIDPSNNEIQRETITLHLPAAPMIEGFTFLKWQVVAGDLEDAIFIQAVYTENDPQFAPAVYTNPANPTQKLIRNGNVYILTGDKVYTITGQAVR